MLLTNKRVSHWFCLMLSFFLLTGCNTKESDRQYYLLLMGESENWNLKDYEMVITPKDFKVGYGTLYMKNKKEYNTDSFHFDTYVVINNEETVVHSGSVTGGINIAEKTTGAIEGETFVNENGDSIKLNDISEIYMIVEWWDKGQSKSVEERIDLYKKDSKEQTFLNQ